jgi:hypothetical protein
MSFLPFLRGRDQGTERSQKTDLSTELLTGLVNFSAGLGY